MKPRYRICFSVHRDYIIPQFALNVKSFVILPTPSNPRPHATGEGGKHVRERGRQPSPHYFPKSTCHHLSPLGGGGGCDCCGREGEKGIGAGKCGEVNYGKNFNKGWFGVLSRARPLLADSSPKANDGDNFGVDKCGLIC